MSGCGQELTLTNAALTSARDWVLPAGFGGPMTAIDETSRSSLRG
jgi:hypothetical protein